VSATEWTDVFAQMRQDRAGRLEAINQQLGDFVRAYDRYVIAEGMVGNDDEYNAASAELTRQYELLDTLGVDRP
jgi:hypothetical protein